MITFVLQIDCASGRVGDMSNTDDGGPAFPRETYGSSGSPSGGQCGMSLRDYFAAKALPDVFAAYIAQNVCGCAADHAIGNIPALAYKYADAMLEARK